MFLVGSSKHELSISSFQARGGKQTTTPPHPPPPQKKLKFKTATTTSTTKSSSEINILPTWVSFCHSTSPFMAPTTWPPANSLNSRNSLSVSPGPLSAGVILLLAQIFSAYSCWWGTVLRHCHHMLVDVTGWSLGIFLSCFTLGWHLCRAQRRDCAKKDCCLLHKRTPLFSTDHFKGVRCLGGLWWRASAGPTVLATVLGNSSRSVPYRITCSVWQPGPSVCQPTSRHFVNPALAPAWLAMLCLWQAALLAFVKCSGSFGQMVSLALPFGVSSQLSIKKGKARLSFSSPLHSCFWIFLVLLFFSYELRFKKMKVPLL